MRNEQTDVINTQLRELGNIEIDKLFNLLRRNYIAFKSHGSIMIVLNGSMLQVYKHQSTWYCKF